MNFLRVIISLGALLLEKELLILSVILGFCSTAPPQRRN